MKTAFLNAAVEEELYCEPLPDQLRLMRLMLKHTNNLLHIQILSRQIKHLEKGHKLRLRKALYGLKQAPRNWYLMLDAHLKKLGFKACISDVCLYSMSNVNDHLMILLYVDDMLVASNNEVRAKEFTKELGKAFKLSNEGPLQQYLNINFDHDRIKREITMKMESYIERKFKLFGLTAKENVLTPMQENLHISTEEEIENKNFDNNIDSAYITDFKYREKVGSLLYLMICMRPDIAFAVSTVAKFSANPTKSACAAVTRLFQYVYNTKNYCITFSGDKVRIIGYVDSDWAGDKNNRRSLSGYILYIGRSPVEWGSKLQLLVANSTAEAEFIAINKPAKSIQWMRWLLSELKIPGVKQSKASVLFVDNAAAIAMAKNPVHQDRTKHIAIKYFHIRTLIQFGVIHVEHINTNENVADMLTKSLGKIKHTYHRKRALGSEDLHTPTGKRMRTKVSDEYA
jgi:hypothetical protein